MKKLALSGALALALVSTPARADFLGDLFGGSWLALARGNLASVARRFVGRGNFTGFRGPWCGAAISSWVAIYAGRNPHILRARDWARYGRPSRLVAGAIVVQPHHVYVSTGGTCGVGGNEHGRVAYRCGRSMRSVIAVRAP
jgi:hypothetical protein